jgi:multiple sugar transport system permease protein
MMRTNPAQPNLRRRLAKAWNRHKWSYFFIAPSMLLFGVFIVYPVLQAFLYAFQRVDTRSATWVGLDNFRSISQSALFWASMRHTVVYAVCVVGAWITTSLLVAALIQPLRNSIQSLFRAAFYLPNVISIVVIALVWLWILDPEYGVFNWLLSLVGVNRVLWLQNPDIALWSIVLSTVLIVPGSGVVLYSAAIGSIPHELYEAADVEGAGPLQKWLHITIPLLKPTTLYLMVIYTIAGFQIFERVYIMTAGGPINATTTIVQLIYQTGFNDFNYGRASAEALILFAIIASFSFVQFKFLSTDVEY